MPRWEPHAKQRLETAALDLYATQGYENTTIAEIASHAGVTSRTYFRHFPDKREVLFGTADELHQRLTDALTDADPLQTPLHVCLDAMKNCVDLFHRRDHFELRRRDQVIESSHELQEREARKLASMAAEMASALAARGVDLGAGRLIADIAMAIFVRASRLWMSNPSTPFPDAVDHAAAEAQAAFPVRATEPRS